MNQNNLAIQRIKTGYDKVQKAKEEMLFFYRMSLYCMDEKEARSMALDIAETSYIEESDEIDEVID